MATHVFTVTAPDIDQSQLVAVANDLRLDVSRRTLPGSEVTVEVNGYVSEDAATVAARVEAEAVAAAEKAAAKEAAEVKRTADAVAKAEADAARVEAARQAKIAKRATQAKVVKQPKAAVTPPPDTTPESRAEAAENFRTHPAKVEE